MNAKNVPVLVGWVGCVVWQVLKVLEGHAGSVMAVAISTDGAKIVSGSMDKTVRVWSMETGEVPACMLHDGRRIRVSGPLVGLGICVGLSLLVEIVRFRVRKSPVCNYN